MRKPVSKRRGRPAVGKPVLPEGLNVEWHPGIDLLPRKVVTFGPFFVAVGIGEPPRPKRQRGAKAGRNTLIQRTIAHEVIRLERALTKPPHNMTQLEARKTAIRAIAAAAEFDEKTIGNALTVEYLKEADTEQDGYLTGLEIQRQKIERAQHRLPPFTPQEEAAAFGEVFQRISRK